MLFALYRGAQSAALIRRQLDPLALLIKLDDR
jgi:hypothetical protein